MIRIAILGDIGSGKSYIAKCFGYPVFNADKEVSKLYKNNFKVFKKLKKTLPTFVNSFPISKIEITKAILSNQNNLKKIIKIIHQEVRIKMNVFLRKNKKKKFIILDIPLLLENKINKKRDVLVFVESKKSEIFKKLKRRNNFNKELYKKFRNIQLPISYKKKKSHYVIKNNFNKNSARKKAKDILKRIQL